ncbi:MAG: translation initiation factor, partial [Flavobacteriales bacterium]
SPNEQLLYVSLDRKNRSGKAVSLVEGFVGNKDDLKALSKSLKQACGVGGNEKDGNILIQGDHRNKVVDLLEKAGYKVKRKGG